MKLKPCPCCGGEAKSRPLWDVNPNRNLRSIICQNCDVELITSGIDAEEEAIENWNKRPGERAARVEELKRILTYFPSVIADVAYKTAPDYICNRINELEAE